MTGIAPVCFDIRRKSSNFAVIIQVQTSWGNSFPINNPQK